MQYYRLKIYWPLWLSLFCHVDDYISPCFYWRVAPTLELPERAESLQEWSHCLYCGMPLSAENCLAHVWE